MPFKVLGIIGLQAEDVVSIKGFVALKSRPIGYGKGRKEVMSCRNELIRA